MNPLLLIDDDPLLMIENVDEWVCENLMYDPIVSPETKPIKDSGKRGSERIYRILRELEEDTGIKF